MKWQVLGMNVHVSRVSHGAVNCCNQDFHSRRGHECNRDFATLTPSFQLSKGKNRSRKVKGLPFVLDFHQRYTTEPEFAVPDSALESTNCTVDAKGHLDAAVEGREHTSPLFQGP